MASCGLAFLIGLGLAGINAAGTEFLGSVCARPREGAGGTQVTRREGCVGGRSGKMLCRKQHYKPKRKSARRTSFLAEASRTRAFMKAWPRDSPPPPLPADVVGSTGSRVAGRSLRRRGGIDMATEGDVELELETETSGPERPPEKPRKHDSGAADLERVTDYAEEKEIQSSNLETVRWAGSGGGSEGVTGSPALGPGHDPDGGRRQEGNRTITGTRGLRKGACW